VDINQSDRDVIGGALVRVFPSRPSITAGKHRLHVSNRPQHGRLCNTCY